MCCRNSHKPNTLTAQKQKKNAQLINNEENTIEKKQKATAYKKL
jgi:hypothetical protein